MGHICPTGPSRVFKYVTIDIARTFRKCPQYYLTLAYIFSLAV